jgi:hypothetical protein
LRSQPPSAAQKTGALGEWCPYRIGDDGSVWSRKKGGWCRLKPWPNRRGGGHLYLNLRPAASDKVKNLAVHRLVLEAFRGPRPPGLLCCHGEGGVTDNRIENLRWDTPAANTADAMRAGTHPCGVRHPGTRLTYDDIAEIRRLRDEERLTFESIGLRFGVSSSHVGNIIRGLRWGATPRKYLHLRGKRRHRP